MFARILLVVLAFTAYAPAANACADDMDMARMAPRVDSVYGSTVGFLDAEVARATADSRCECPALATGEASAIVGAEKERVAMSTGSGMFESSLADLRKFVSACGKPLATAAPSGSYPLYLLTARLRR